MPSPLTTGTSVDLLRPACRLAYALLVLGHSTHYWETRGLSYVHGRGYGGVVFESEDLAASELFPYLSVCGLGLWGPFIRVGIR